MPGSIFGETPTRKTLAFIGKKDKQYFVAMKRGYQPDTISITKESSTDIYFKLKSIDGIHTPPFNPNLLKNADFYFLPVTVKVILHKGVGNLDKYVPSEELSKDVTAGLNRDLIQAQHRDNLNIISLSEMKDPAEWMEISEKLEKYLLSLNPSLLPFYGEPATVMNVLTEKDAIDKYIKTDSKQAGNRQYLVYIWCKSIKSTTGRVIGNIATGVAAGAVQGFETSVYGVPLTPYDPEAFNIDNSSLYMAYFIDPGNGEVLYVKQQVVPYKITKPEKIKEFGKVLLAIPDISKTEE